MATVKRTPAELAMLDQADAMFDEQLDVLVRAVRLGIEEGAGAQQVVYDFAALFNHEWDHKLVSALFASALKRIAELQGGAR